MNKKYCLRRWITTAILLSQAVAFIGCGTSDNVKEHSEGQAAKAVDVTHDAAPAPK
jgi:hypothetical protein